MLKGTIFHLKNIQNWSTTREKGLAPYEAFFSLIRSEQLFQLMRWNLQKQSGKGLQLEQ